MESLRYSHWSAMPKSGYGPGRVEPPTLEPDLRKREIRSDDESSGIYSTPVVGSQPLDLKGWSATWEDGVLEVANAEHSSAPRKMCLSYSEVRFSIDPQH